MTTLSHSPPRAQTLCPFCNGNLPEEVFYHARPWIPDDVEESFRRGEHPDYPPVEVDLNLVLNLVCCLCGAEPDKGRSFADYTDRDRRLIRASRAWGDRETGQAKGRATCRPGRRFTYQERVVGACANRTKAQERALHITALLQEGFSIPEVCATLGITRQTIWRARKRRDPILQEIRNTREHMVQVRAALYADAVHVTPLGRYPFEGGNRDSELEEVSIVRTRATGPAYRHAEPGSALYEVLRRGGYDAGAIGEEWAAVRDRRAGRVFLPGVAVQAVAAVQAPEGAVQVPPGTGAAEQEGSVSKRARGRRQTLRNEEDSMTDDLDPRRRFANHMHEVLTSEQMRQLGAHILTLVPDDEAVRLVMALCDNLPYEAIDLLMRSVDDRAAAALLDEGDEHEGTPATPEFGVWAARVG